MSLLFMRWFQNLKLIKIFKIFYFFSFFFFFFFVDSRTGPALKFFRFYLLLLGFVRTLQQYINLQLFVSSLLYGERRFVSHINSFVASSYQFNWPWRLRQSYFGIKNVLIQPWIWAVCFKYIDWVQMDYLNRIKLSIF